MGAGRLLVAPPPWRDVYPESSWEVVMMHDNKSTKFWNFETILKFPVNLEILAERLPEK